MGVTLNFIASIENAEWVVSMEKTKGLRGFAEHKLLSQNLAKEIKA